MHGTINTNPTGYKYTLSVEHRLNHSPAKVWRALTERDFLRQWYPADVVGDWSVGAKLEFLFEPEQHADVTEDDLHGEVLAVEEPALLEYRWGSHSMRFELAEDGGGCRLTLSESFNEKAWSARNAAGWEMCIENLALILDGESAAEFDPSVWREKFDRYAEQYEGLVGPRGGLPEGDPLLKMGRE